MFRFPTFLRTFVLFICAIGLTPLAPVGFGSWRTAEAEGEQSPNETGNTAKEIAISIAEHRLDLQQRRTRRGWVSTRQTLPGSAHLSGRRSPEDLRPSPIPRDGTFLLPLRC